MLSQQQLLAKTLSLLPHYSKEYKKIRRIFARKAEKGEQIETITADGKETVNIAEQGDFVVKNQTGAGECYLMNRENFEKRYVFLKKSENGFSEYKSIGKILAVELKRKVLEKMDCPEEFWFEAPWGESMIAKKGDFLALPPDLSMVYRIARKEFFETYKKL